MNPKIQIKSIELVHIGSSNWFILRWNQIKPIIIDLVSDYDFFIRSSKHPIRSTFFYLFLIFQNFVIKFLVIGSLFIFFVNICLKNLYKTPF